MSGFNPDPIGQPTFRPQHPIRLEDLRIISRRAADAGRSAATGGTADGGAGMGLQIGEELRPEGFYARLTLPAASESNPFYSFMEMQDDGTGDGWVTPNGGLNGTANAVEANNNWQVVVPGPPNGLAATKELNGSLNYGTYYYAVAALWYNAYTMETLQSVPSEVSAVIGGGYFTVQLTWTAPTNPLPGFILSGYQIWRGTASGQENVLLTTLSIGETSFTDDGTNQGTPAAPLPAGNAGPIVWMYTHSAWNYYKFVLPVDLHADIALLLSSVPDPSTGLYDAIIQYYDPTDEVWLNGPAIWLRDANQ